MPMSARRSRNDICTPVVEMQSGIPFGGMFSHLFKESKFSITETPASYIASNSSQKFENLI